MHLRQLRSYAIARTFFKPTTLERAIRQLGFVQADPIRAPARAQDLTLRHRVRNYRAGDLERRYPSLGIEEDCLVNYGFLPREHLALMHPREPRAQWNAATRRRAQDVLAFIRERGTVHPREVSAQFQHGRATNAWGGTSNATTRLLDGMHYRGLLRVVRREQGIRVYAAHDHPTQPDDAAARRARVDALVALVVAKYAPLPAVTLGSLVRMLRYAVPNLGDEQKEALLRAKAQLPHARVDGIDWYWPVGESMPSVPLLENDEVRLLAPFDPAVWDRRRFSLFWGWTYRFEAYVPHAKRKLGYYALPLLWRDEMIGWGNVSVVNQHLVTELNYVNGTPPRDRLFRRQLDAEIARLKSFLRL